MTDGKADSERAQAQRSGLPETEAAAAKLLQDIAVIAIADEAVAAATKPATPHRRDRRIVRSQRQRRPARLTHRKPRPTAAVEPAVEPVDTQAELRNWIKDNATLLSNASLLISLAAVALSLLPPVGFIDPYLKALIFGAAIILLIELHHQWPDELQIHLLRPMDLPDNHSWRMAAFAFFIQSATLLFGIWAVASYPIMLFPLTGLGVVFLFRRWYFGKPRGWLSRFAGVLSLILILLISELLMVVVWAAVTKQTVTIELWKEDRPGLERKFVPRG
jgi:hypothetical protein